ncbi:MAG: hypothetical protein AAGH83_00410 [Pseudomonadota bacterium]
MENRRIGRHGLELDIAEAERNRSARAPGTAIAAMLLDREWVGLVALLAAIAAGQGGVCRLKRRKLTGCGGAP